MNYLQMYINIAVVLSILLIATLIWTGLAHDYPKQRLASRVGSVVATFTVAIGLIFCTAMAGLLS